jgi:hypothetical protein
MALPRTSGKLVTAQVEASIAGAAGTYLENKSYYTNSSGQDVGITVGSPSVNDGKITKVSYSLVYQCSYPSVFLYRSPKKPAAARYHLPFLPAAVMGKTSQL